jgi:hypothetical protein
MKKSKVIRKLRKKVLLLKKEVAILKSLYENSHSGEEKTSEIPVDISMMLDKEMVDQIENLGFTLQSFGNGRVEYTMPEKAYLTLFPDRKGLELSVYPRGESAPVMYKNIFDIASIRTILREHKLISTSPWPKSFKP